MSRPPRGTSLSSTYTSCGFSMRSPFANTEYTRFIRYSQISNEALPKAGRYCRTYCDIPRDRKAYRDARVRQPVVPRTEDNELLLKLFFGALGVSGSLHRTEDRVSALPTASPVGETARRLAQRVRSGLPHPSPRPRG